METGPEKWSIAAVAEHVTVAEGVLFAKLHEAVNNCMEPAWERKTFGKTELLLRVMAQRRGRVKAPPSVVPQANWTREEARRIGEPAQARRYGCSL